MIFFLPKCDYLLTVSHGGDGLDFWLSEQVVKTESSLLPKQLRHQEYTIQLHFLNKTLVDTIRLDPRYSRSEIPTFRTGHQDGIQPFTHTIRTSRIYHTTTPSQQDSCGYDKVWTTIIQCTYDIEYCWRSTDITGPSQASSIHLLITASIVLLDQDFRRHPLCLARTSRRFVDTFRLRKTSRKAAHLVKPNAESVVWLKN